jgi:hypothetical protein
MSDTEASREPPSSDDKPANFTETANAKPARARPARKVNAPTGKSNVQIHTGPNLKKWAPYILAALTIAIVAALVQTPTFAAAGTLVGALIVCALLGFAAAGHRIQLKSDDGLRRLIVPVTVAIVLPCAMAMIWTVYPPAAKGTVELREVGQHAAVDLQGGIDLWATIQGQVDRNATGNADFSIALTNGAQREDLRGRLHVQDNGLIEHRNLSIRGPGTLHFELRGMASALTPPLRVTIHARPIPRLYMGVIAFLLACIAIAIDAALRNRGIEPAYAAALCPLIVAMMYLQLRPVAGAGLPTDFLAAGLLGLLIGGLGGEGMGRLVRACLRR